MIPKIYTETEIAARLHRNRRWLMDWLCRNPTDPSGRPLYMMLGRSRRFTAEDIVSIIDLILTQEEAEKPKGRSEGCVYFVDGGEHIKIGFSTSIKNRMTRMGTDLPGGPEVLLVIPGTFKTEKILHRHFSTLRVRGEWFRKAPELLDYIDQKKQIEEAQA